LLYTALKEVGLCKYGDGADCVLPGISSLVEIDILSSAAGGSSITGDVGLSDEQPIMLTAIKRLTTENRMWWLIYCKYILFV
tara:strand:+ start:210 stop:455 length:246 start_codon:yes stop_codon:yes gene_type:complete